MGVSTTHFQKRGAMLGFLLTMLLNLEDLWGANTCGTSSRRTSISNTLGPPFSSNSNQFELSFLISVHVRTLRFSAALLSSYLGIASWCQRRKCYINFEESAISFEYFSQLLSGITGLRSFTHGFHVGSIGADPYRLIDLHLLQSRTTFEYLELYRLAADQFDPHERACSGSLREFEVLKDARVNLVFGVYTMVFTE